MKELKNGRSALVNCNSVKLREAIEKRGFDHRDFAELLNYDRSYFNKVFRTNKIGVTCVKLLNDRFGISPDMYGAPLLESCPATIKKASPSVKDLIIRKRDHKKKESEPPIQLVMKAEIDPNQLKELIKQAVLEAFNEL